ncbi:MAG: DUF1080 domain-containing protein [Bacteroidetes bacterium]|nr:DUF1080 domain-containing protein [Bacteroidota bacterium]
MKTILFPLVHRFCFVLIAVLFYSVRTDVSAQEMTAIEGRWDMTIQKDGRELPSWLEIEKSGRKTLVGRFVYAFGSARPIAVVNVANGKFSFSIPPQWEQGTRNMDFEGELDGGNLKGTMIYTDDKKYTWTAVRAPLLRGSGEPAWGQPIKLINDADMKGWHAMGENQWKVENGVLRSAKSGSNLVSDQKFSDFKLHIEFRYDKGSNSGVYLRGRYEVQIEDNKGKEPSKTYLGGVYGFLTPSEMVAKDPGEWQSYDVTLIGRMVTVVANGVTIISNQEIPGITGGAIDSKEGEPGPLLLQGDHGPIDFRNIVITPAK